MRDASVQTRFNRTSQSSDVGAASDLRERESSRVALRSSDFLWGKFKEALDPDLPDTWILCF